MSYRPWLWVTVLGPVLWLVGSSCSVVNGPTDFPNGTAGAGAAQGGAGGSGTTSTSTTHTTSTSTTSNTAGHGGTGNGGAGGTGNGGAGGQGGSPECSAPDECPPPTTCHDVACVGGHCTYPSSAAGTSCESVYFCTTGDSCLGGACVAGPDPVCTSPDACQIAGCDENADSCSLQPVTQCISGDGCCPQSCTHSTDSDCAIVSVTYGYAAEFPQASGHSAGYLLGNRIDVLQPIMLTHLALISKQNGPNVNMGLYTDSGGTPATLVATTGAMPVSVGVMEVPVANLPLAAGSYWFMAVFDTAASVGIQFNVPTDVVDYVSFGFSGSLPASYPGGVQSYTGQGMNYYVRGYL